MSMKSSCGLVVAAPTGRAAVSLECSASPAARLLSYRPDHRAVKSSAKIVHFVRHAEGTHNLAGASESKLPLHHDARLTVKGREQCHDLSISTRNLGVECVIVSPMSRCLETAKLSFPHCYESQEVPFVADENWRETVNYLCDSRQRRTVLKGEYPSVDFNFIDHDDDPLWNHYEDKFGCYKTHTRLRESNDPESLFKRIRSAWQSIFERSEKNIAVVSHSAFFLHQFQPYHQRLQNLIEYGDQDVHSSLRFACVLHYVSS